MAVSALDQISNDPTVIQLIDMARNEDMGSSDVSTSLLDDPDRPSRFGLTIKQSGVIAGLSIVSAILKAYDERLCFHADSQFDDGCRFNSTPVCIGQISGPLGLILSAERVVLNFLQRLSGIASITRQYVDAIAQTSARIYDTRKTTPGWRILEKYAVRCGGGCNHRFGLYDAVLIKDNHLFGVPVDRLAAHVFSMLNRLDPTKHDLKCVEVEVDSLEQMDALLGVVGIDVILLDNFNVEQLTEAVKRRNDYGLNGKVDLEASGGISLDRVVDIAHTGIERISVGAITHSAAALDISLDQKDFPENDAQL